MTSRRTFLELAGGSAVAAFTASDKQCLASNEAARQLARPQSSEDLLVLQQRFVDLRFGMFLHFNMATYQDREWGDPTSSPALFQPSDLDTDQWAAAAKSAKMSWGCLTTRHHDGFCIWPTKTAGDSVAKTTHKTDVVRAYVDSFRKAGLRVGLYYSILSLRDDIRHFNVTPQKINLIKAQLTEIFTNYGEIDILITDGWDAPWSRITYDEVPFREIYDHIKAMQPNCLICDLNAASYPSGGLYYSDIKAFEQNAGQRVPQESRLPSLSCVTLTDGWFWKQADLHGNLKPAETVVTEWLVPLNRLHCNLILNAPPGRDGKLAPNVVERLAEIGRLWNPEPVGERLKSHPVITSPNLAKGMPIHASSSPDTVGPDLANDGSLRSAWSPEHIDRSPWLEVDLKGAHYISIVSLVQGNAEDQESTVKDVRFQGWSGTAWETIAHSINPEATTVVAVPHVVANRIHISFVPGTRPPVITEIGVYGSKV